MEKSENDKWDFLETVYIHGADVEKLSVHLPSWTKSEIEHTIKRFRNRAKRKLADEENTASKTAALNHWVKVTENLHQLQGSTNQPWWRKGRRKLTEEPKDHAPILSKTLLYAACFEDHYEGGGPNDPNYNEIYRYLSQLVEGTEPTRMSSGSAGKVLEMLSKIKKIVNDECAVPYMKKLQKLNPSYLPEVPGNPKKKGRTIKEEPNDDIRPEESSFLVCPLFKDELDDEPTVEELEPSDPYYELKRDEMVRKIQDKQMKQASSLCYVPGLNPMELTVKDLAKPGKAIIEAGNL